MAGAVAPPLEAPQPTPAIADRSPLAIREALPEERSQAWELQRSAFGLPDGPPPPHPGTHDELRVVVRDGRVVSCLTLIHAELAIGGASLSMGGIRHVATHPDEQNQGYASALLRSTLRHMRDEALGTSVLFPFSFRYYRKFGYELGGNHCQFWCRPNCVPAYVERRDCRRASAADIPALERFYARRSGRSACTFARTTARWGSICADPEAEVVVHGAGDGYAVTTEDRDSYGGRVLRVLELTADTPRAWRGLLGHLSQFQGESIEWLAGSDDLCASGLLRTPAPLREGFKPRGIATVRPMFQFRVIDLERALQARLPSFPRRRYRLAVQVSDEQLPQNEQAVTIEGRDGGATLRRGAADAPMLRLSIQTFSQLFCGYMCPSEAASQGLLTASDSDAIDLADSLFPAGDPFISELDRF